MKSFIGLSTAVAFLFSESVIKLPCSLPSQHPFDPNCGYFNETLKPNMSPGSSYGPL